MNNTLLLQNAFSVNGLKEEECQQDSVVDDKVQVSETTIINEVQDNLILGKIKQYNISTNVDYIKTELSSSEVQYDMIDDNIKAEEGISTDNIKIEFSSGFLYCEDCQLYCEDYCTKCDMLMHILNKTVPINTDNMSEAELPNNILEIRDYSGESHIFASRVIPVGVKFGPFTGINGTGGFWKIKAGKFVGNEDRSAYLNWMQYINLTKSISTRNLVVFQYEDNLYYQSTCQINEGDELLVYIGEEYEDSLNRNIEMDFIPTSAHIFKDAFACTFCCLGFSTKSYLAKHKAICLANADGEFSIEEVAQCPFCKINMGQKEYIKHHMDYCCKMTDRKCILPTTSSRATPVNERRTRSHQMYKCQRCKYRTKYKGDLKNHANQHYEVKMYKCGVCRRLFKTKEVLRLHVENAHVFTDGRDHLERFRGTYMKAHIKAEDSSSQNEVKQFKCSMCEVRTKYKSSLKKHMAVKHLKEINYKCNTCDYKANRMSHLKIHLQDVHLIKFKYKCDICDYNTNNKCNLNTHKVSIHFKLFNYKCDSCDYKARLKSELKRHIKARHSQEFKYKCDTCNYKANWKANLKTHIETRHLKEFRYKCDGCDYKANQKRHLKTHIETRHLKEFKYKCDECDYKTNFKWHLESHKLTHFKQFNYKGDKANLESQLKEHIETRHMKEFKYKCDTCDYKTNLKSALKDHVKVRHLKEFKYKCGECDYKTNRENDLKRHIEARHLTEYKYKCDACDYKTNRENYLKKHIETRHLKEFKYKCDGCDYKTNRKDALKIHVERMHLREFKHKCDMCDYKASTKPNLIFHVKSKHLRLLSTMPGNDAKL